jgi:hypothetical protein
MARKLSLGIKYIGMGDDGYTVAETYLTGETRSRALVEMQSSSVKKALGPEANDRYQAALDTINEIVDLKLQHDLGLIPSHTPDDAPS